MSLFETSTFVIAVGYTTPGFEALALGIPTIFFTHADIGGEPFKPIPNLVALGEEQLLLLSGRALSNPQVFADSQREAALQLEPFRDAGCAVRAATIVSEAILNPHTKSSDVASQ